MYDNNNRLVADNLDFCYVHGNKGYILNINNNYSLYNLKGEIIEKDLLLCLGYENGFYIKLVEEVNI